MSETSRIRRPARTPCGSCPYRRDVPSGVWAPEEYAKLPLYDRETWDQPIGVFQCHQATRRVCAGWAGTHEGDQLLALRLAPKLGTMTPADVEATIDYASPVPLFVSGAEAARHGLAELEAPGPQAAEVQRKIVRVRTRGPGVS